MNKRSVFVCTGFLLAMAICPPVLADLKLENKDFRLTIGNSGQVSSMLDRVGNVEYLAEGQGAFLLQVRHEKQWLQPARMAHDAGQGILYLYYGHSGIKAKIVPKVKETHIRFELVSLDPLNKVEAVQWGPLPTTIKETVGEIVGVVRNDAFAIGIQALNVKTLGGPLPNEEGVENARGAAAKATEWGSTLQAYSLDRSRPRKITVWGTHYPNMPVPPIKGETPVGSAIALFGCKAEEALNRIGAIEIVEGLPHPVFEDVWSKQSPLPTRPYWVTHFDERSFDKVLEHAVQANFATIYHMGPFVSWGHFELNPKQFPNGKEGLKACVAKAREKGIHLGVHTLSNFIQTNDPYVTPVPDPRLAKTGASILTEEVGPEADEITVASPEYFDARSASWLHTVMIGQELVRYASVSETAPWRLLDCQRGAFGTQASKHKEGDEVAKLMDHPYKVFLGDFEMNKEIAIRLAALFNETGMMHLDFDGHEGCWSTGQGDYGCEFFAKTFYDHLDQPVRHGSSISKHFYWHINSAENWGEPYYAGFRKSQTEYRFNNQPLFDRNLMPRMLGWFLLKRTTTLADIEWMLARSAGYNAGYALQSDLLSMMRNSEKDAVLDAIREWDEARRGGAFSEAQKAALMDSSREFHLEKAGENVWKLYAFNTTEPYVYEDYIRQPGEPTGAEWDYTNPDEKQPLQFFLEVEGEEGSFANFAIEFDSYSGIEIEATIDAGEQLVCDGTDVLRIYDADGHPKKDITLSRPLPEIASGAHKVSLVGEFSGDSSPKVLLRLKTQGEPQTVTGAAVS